MAPTRRSILSAMGGVPLSTLALSGTGLGDEGDCEYGTIQPDDAGDVELWHPRSEAGNQLLETTEFRWENDSESTLRDTQIPVSNFLRKLQTSIPSGDGPHLFEWVHDRAGKFDRNGFLSDQSGNIDIPDCMLTDTALDAATYEGKRIGVPWSAQTVALFYNADMVDEPPSNLEEMKAIMEAHHDPDNGQYGLAYPINPYFVSGFAQAYGEAIYDGEADTLGITSDEVVKGLRIVMDEFKPYMRDDPATSAQLSVFREGNAPMYISGPWDVTGLRDADFELGLTTLPSLPDGGQPRPYTGIKLLYFASRMDDDADAGAALDFAEWYASNETLLLEHANQGGFVPVHTKLVGNEALPEYFDTFARQVQNGYPMPKNPKMDKVWGPFGDAVVQTFNGNGKLEDNLELARESIYEGWALDNLLVNLPGESNPAASIDADPQLEDVDGDGDGDLFDALEYYEHRESDAIQDHPAYFDFDGDGDSGDLFDALALWEELS